VSVALSVGLLCSAAHALQLYVDVNKDSFRIAEFKSSRMVWT